jgi:hypothetical protein
MNTIFLPSQMRSRANAMRDEMLPEMTRHFDRWGHTSPCPLFVGRSNDVPSWEANIDTMLMFGDSRISLARNYIQNQFGLTKQVDVTLDVQPAGAGKIKISTITPDALPWTGVYFDGVPVTMTAIANPGYHFNHWLSPVLITVPDPNSSMTMNITSDDTFTAYFDVLENSFSVYPNPFSDQLTVNYTLPKSKQISIKVYDVIGRIITKPISDLTMQTEGVHSFIFDANDYALADGVYFIKIKTDDFSQTVKIIRTRTK